MLVLLTFAVVTCMVLGGGLILFSGVVMALTVACCTLFSRTSNPDLKRLEYWLSKGFLWGSVLCSIATVGVLFLAVLS